MVPKVSGLTHVLDDSPLTPADVAEMKEHLAFFREWRTALRLQLNAAEDLLVNGQREPTERGVCRHLLAKLDRAAVDAALQREPARSDPSARVRLLGGAVRVTGDVGVLLSYLESLTALKSREEGAAAFREVVKRIDFSGLSASRLGRLLQVLAEVLQGPARTQALLGLWGNAGFGALLRQALPQLPSDVAQVVRPLHAVLDDVSSSREEMQAGLREILQLPQQASQGLPLEVKSRVLERALGGVVEINLARDAAKAFLGALPRQGRDYSRLTMRLAGLLLTHHQDAEARVALEVLKAAQPDYRQPARWLQALDSPRHGRVALVRQAQGDGRMVPAFWLDAQKDVWVRTPGTEHMERVRAEVQLQNDALLPGVAPLVLHVEETPGPLVATLANGQPLALSALPADARGVFLVVSVLGRILHALSLQGITLPDARLHRFMAPPGHPAQLTLADFDGALSRTREESEAAHLRALLDLLAEVSGPRHLPGPPAEGAASLPGLIRWMERAL